MAQTSSLMVPLGTKAPDFDLQDVVTAAHVHLYDTQGEKGTLIMFICNHCPYVKHVLDELVQIGAEYGPQGIKTIAISSNDVSNYPEDSPEKMKELALSRSFSFPYLYDETQDVAKAYDAACTPDFYLYDKNLLLVYRGQLDGARPKNDIAVTGKDLRQALDSVVAGKQVNENQIRGLGCNIKWKG